MALTQDQKKHLLKLTALKDMEGLSLDSILEYFTLLQQVDTSSVSVSTRSGCSVLAPRLDRIQASPSSSESLLACSPERIAAHQIVLSGILHVDA